MRAGQRGCDLETPTPFDLDRTVRSHGFYDLAPWRYDPARLFLVRPIRLTSGRVVSVEVVPADPGQGLALRIAAEGRLRGGEAVEVRRVVRRCLSLDDDLTAFHRRIEELETSPRRAARAPSLLWAVRIGAGRLLRSPTVYEDAVKTLCTTNCSWALTRAMVKNLVERLGDAAPDGARDFPTAAAMAEQPERFYRDVVRAGYRAGALRWIASAVASGAIDMESWRSSEQSTESLAAVIAELPGFGLYATEHLLRLLGRHDHLALDSWTRAKLARLRGSRRVPSDATFRRWFAPFGPHAGLAMWLEVTADWHEEKPSWP
jgi:N-glycosylase/DNA lyase